MPRRFLKALRRFSKLHGKRFRVQQQKLPGREFLRCFGWFIIYARQIHHLAASTLNADVGHVLAVTLQREAWFATFFAIRHRRRRCTGHNFFQFLKWLGRFVLRNDGDAKLPVFSARQRSHQRHKGFSLLGCHGEDRRACQVPVDWKGHRRMLSVSREP